MTDKIICIIDKNGSLILDGIKRYCPFAESKCNIHCALFQIQEEDDDVKLYLCHKIIEMKTTKFRNDYIFTPDERSVMTNE